MIPLGNRFSHHSTVSDEFYYNPRGAKVMTNDDGKTFFGNTSQPILNQPKPLSKFQRGAFFSMNVPLAMYSIKMAR